MTVITGGSPNGGYGRFVDNTSKNGVVNNESSSYFNAPNNGNQVTASVDPADQRLAKSKLQREGIAVPKSAMQDPKVQFGQSDSSGNDWRVRISISPSSKILYYDPTITGTIPSLLTPLRHTDGFIFPYVPTVQITHNANYSSVPLTHSNYAQYFYESSSVSSITVSGEFTVQNLDEARYFLAGIYFFRACTKMFYGLTADYQGSPPPIVYLDGYGQHYLPHVPCVITSFSHAMPDSVDYIEVNTPQSMSASQSIADNSSSYYQAPGTGAGAGTVLTNQTINTAFNRVPTASTFNVTLQPIISRAQAINFDYKEFARGGLIVGKGNPFTGGYL